MCNFVAFWWAHRAASLRQQSYLYSTACFTFNIAREFVALICFGGHTLKQTDDKTPCVLARDITAQRAADGYFNAF